MRLTMALLGLWLGKSQACTDRACRLLRQPSPEDAWFQASRDDLLWLIEELDLEEVADLNGVDANGIRNTFTFEQIEILILADLVRAEISGSDE